MAKKYVFLPFFFSLLAGAAWWSHQIADKPDVGPMPAPASVVVRGLASPSAGIQNSKRVELLEFLDRVVAYQHYYRSVYGTFTENLLRVGLRVPRSVSDIYQIRIIDASSDLFRINAFSSLDEKGDQVSVDQDYKVHANFSVPGARPEYLRNHAMRHLRLLSQNPPGRLLEEGGIFRGYFRYDVKQEGEKQAAFAIGIRPPVLGLQLEAGQESFSDAAFLDTGSNLGEMDVASTEARQTGQKPLGNVLSTLEEVYLAQFIFHGEVGRYARSWSELSRITAFRFEDKERYGLGTADGENLVVESLIDGPFDEATVAKSRIAERALAGRSDGLVIEPVLPDR